MLKSRVTEGKDRFDRRIFCKAAGLAAAVGLVEAGTGSRLAHADLTQEQRDKMTPDEVIQAMKAGNERFRSGKPQHRDLMREVKATAKGQYPAAIVFSCVDSRAPAELILDFGIGEIFSARVAGNVADEDVLGSIEFACKVAGSKVALIMGHTSCGAIKGAIDGVQLGNLTALLSKIRPAVEATHYPGERSAKNYAFVDAVARENVLLTIAKIREKSSVLRELESAGSIKVAGSMYNLETGAVEFLA
ncbi:MAG TPA: carbonic anhydrase family protein [Terriglobales bacterium]|jgi:carbonic anhydrase|nr:carbonic anhydrase family protein [Terriglobales bacterium]